MPLFSRSDASKAQPEPQPEGRRTPKQSEQVARNRRPLVPEDRKEARRQMQDKMRAEREKARLGFERGDEKYLPARDKGPVRRFVRDWVDARLSLGTLAMPMMIVVLVLTFINDPQWRLVANIVLWSFVLLVVLDSVFMAWQLRRAVRARFGAKEAKGNGWYATMRAVQMPFMRMPKPQTKLFRYPE
ncbi:DUF3043 domain-containing protein [Agrococcus sp. SL85]|uniref:DUF3043 domain-containing protein n=1 Tax=Agrococcus sp. SL85 TaxID=2995141 RepID=UPI00226CCB16|nr:DUF3043 domain-containing protein [Agrococcus sp. SL85]WAC66147.1 DUF3043 domain-containing protein [Agrococcus sp. SL85]